MIVVVVLHMTQVFLYGAYKKPREATWGVGIALLLLTLAYGLTGYLLPWDNRAYWGTVVTTQIASEAPLLGPYITRLLGGEDSIGVVTFARFFALHVLLLPPVTTFLIAFHIYLVRKHGVAPAPGDTRPPKKFFPDQIFKDTIAIFAAFIILFVLAVAAKVPLERLADPTDTTYTPRPDWYFLFLFQILKSFEGPLEVVGSVVLPTMAILALLLVPFLDRGVAKRLAQRTGAFSFVALAAIGWTGLTVTAIVNTPEPVKGSVESTTTVEGWQQLSPEALAGIGYYRKEQCSSCHNLKDGKAKVGPNLATTPIKRSVGWMVGHFKNPAQMVPGTSMPPIHLGDAQLSALAAFLLTLTADNATDLESAPDKIVEGAMIYQQQQCGTCHIVNGVGVQLGPALNGVAGRRSKQWIEVQIRNPKRHSDETMMPAYSLIPRDMDGLIEYLTSLPAR